MNLLLGHLFDQNGGRGVHEAGKKAKEVASPLNEFICAVLVELLGTILVAKFFSYVERSI